MAPMTTAPAAPGTDVAAPSDPWSDLVLTLPMFIGYHLGVIFLPIRNAADVVTRELVALADHDMTAYGGLTLGVGLAFVVVLGLAGRGHALRWQRFALIAAEGVAYAIAMRLIAGYVVGRLTLLPSAIMDSLSPVRAAAIDKLTLESGSAIDGRFAGFVMSLGAGFYEELAFRVGLFGVGLKLLSVFYPATTDLRKLVVVGSWALVTSGLFSAWHYFGALGDSFDVQSFLFRTVCGLAFVTIYGFRGFAPVVWTHCIYDLWVLVF
jgi:hypothetical protein